MVCQCEHVQQTMKPLYNGLPFLYIAGIARMFCATMYYILYFDTNSLNGLMENASIRHRHPKILFTKNMQT